MSVLEPQKNSNPVLECTITLQKTILLNQDILMYSMCSHFKSIRNCRYCRLNKCKPQKIILISEIKTRILLEKLKGLAVSSHTGYIVKPKPLKIPHKNTHSMFRTGFRNF